MGGGIGGLSNVYLYDLQTGQTSLVSMNSLGEPASGGGSFAPDISADGRYVGFESDATNLVLGDGNGFRDVFFRDRGRGLLGDLDNDGDVDAADLAILLGAWGPHDDCPPLHPADLDMDCEVGAEDLAILLGNWTG